MSHYFFDSSALIKRYAVETGTAWVRSSVAPEAGNTVVISRITPVEMVSAAWRRHRSGQVSAGVARAVRRVVDRHANREYRLVGVTEGILLRAMDLIEAYPLRAYDAVQLASALESNARLVDAGQSPLVFVSADKQLLSAATAEGLGIEDPNAHA